MGLDIGPRAVGADECDYTSGRQVGRAYSGFNRFREKLAAEDGIDLAAMAGFGADVQVPWDGITSSLVPLLNHSDCDGELTPAECAQLLPRLSEIHAKWSAPGAPQDVRYEAEYLDQLIALLRYCADNGMLADFH